jgi:hypothetical protein
LRPWAPLRRLLANAALLWSASLKVPLSFA